MTTNETAPALPENSKVVIAGGRSYRFTALDCDKLDELAAMGCIAEVVSGGARGADCDGQWWASRNRVPFKLFRADWQQHGKAAGPIRNGQMADYADALVAFPGGKGTANMVEQMRKRGKPVLDWR